MLSGLEKELRPHILLQTELAIAVMNAIFQKNDITLIKQLMNDKMFR